MVCRPGSTRGASNAATAVNGDFAMRILGWLLLALVATGVSHAQMPNLAYPLKPVGAAPKLVQPVGYGVEVGSGCTSCGGANYAANGYAANYGAPVAAQGCGCGGGQVGQPGFVGGCCDYLKPRARGVWNSYCGDRHLGHGGCGCGGGVTPIGLYGATPYGCCAAGVNCGSGCGLGLFQGHGCGSACGSGCSNCFGWFASKGGCSCGVTKPCGWRMGLGGHPCSTSGPGCTTGCSTGYSGDAHADPTPALPPQENIPGPPALEEQPEIAPALPKAATAKIAPWLQTKMPR